MVTQAELSDFLKREFPQNKCTIEAIGQRTATVRHAIGEAELLALLGAYFSPEDVEVAYWVVRCESNFDAAAYNPSGPYVGLFQHALSAWDSRAASVGFPGADWWNAEANVAASIPLWYGAPPYDASWHWPYCHGWALDQIGG